MLPRRLSEVLDALRRDYPAIAITGPRQSGKTTLVREVAKELPYINFENPTERAEFLDDPKGFFRRVPEGAVLDEVQHLPELLSYLQVEIDANRRMGRWIMTGSQPLDVRRGVSQSLAGRVALLTLLPMSFAEVKEGGRAPKTLAEAVLTGGYPVLHDPDRSVKPTRWLEDYIATFINQDVRQIINVRNRNAFDRFVRLCAARTGQILNAAELSRDCGIDNKTTAAWLGVLEDSYLIHVVRPYARSFGKRMVKSPKLYWIDTGLACQLLGITDINHLTTHPLWGALVETWSISEVVKGRLHRGLPPRIWYWRSSDGIEVDLLFDGGQRVIPWEIKASATPKLDDLAPSAKVAALAAREGSVRVESGILIHGGDEDRPLGPGRAVPWTDIDRHVPEDP
jgi:predicted AAA+ superfamily ATPase